MEEWPPDDGSWGQVQRRGSSRALMGWPVTPSPERVYGMCKRMCTKGFLNYFSAIIDFLKVVLRVKL